MKILFSLATVALTLLTACGAADGGDGSQLASNYPPDYSWNERCADIGTIKACGSEGGSGSFLRLEYRGQLQDAKALSFYVKLNGKDGVFGPFALNAQHAVRLANTGYNCRPDYGPNGHLGTYTCDQPSPAMKELFFYARDQIGRRNAWDLEVAVVDQDGNWDSNLGGNYKLRISL